MSVIVSAPEVFGFYHDLWGSAHHADPPPYLRSGQPFPPALCRSLAFGDPQLAAGCNWTEAMTGSSRAVVESVESGGQRLFWGISDVDRATLEFLPVTGNRHAAATNERRALLQDAMALLGNLGRGYLDSVCGFIGLLVWLERDPEVTNASSLTASSFPTLPHCSAITDRAPMEVLPDTVLSEPSVWVLAESLYHESLHQRLSATILQKNIFTDTYDAKSGPWIYSHWRGAHWPVDRALHALFVYSGVIELRNRALSHGPASELYPFDRALISKCRDDGLEVLAYLGDQVKRARHVLTDEGNALLEELLVDVAILCAA